MCVRVMRTAGGGGERAAEIGEAAAAPDRMRHEMAAPWPVGPTAFR